MSEGIVLYGLGNGARTPRGSFGQRVIRLNDRVIRIPDIDERLRKLHGKVVRMKAKRKMIDVEITREGLQHIRNSIRNHGLNFTEDDLARIDKIMEKAIPAGGSSPDRRGRHAKSKSVNSFRYFSFEHKGQTLYLNIMHKTYTQNGKRITKDVLYDITKKIKN